VPEKGWAAAGSPGDRLDPPFVEAIAHSFADLVVHEEVVEAAFSGRGYAAAAQSAWAHTRVRDPSMHLVGTVDHLNVASRISALRAGRARVLDDVRISLN